MSRSMARVRDLTYPYILPIFRYKIMHEGLKQILTGQKTQICRLFSQVKRS